MHTEAVVALALLVVLMPGCLVELVGNGQETGGVDGLESGKETFKNFEERWSNPVPNYPHVVAISDDGQYITAATAPQGDNPVQVMLFDAQGDELWSHSLEQSFIQFEPNSIAVSNNGSVIVGLYQEYYRFNAEGEFEVRQLTPGASTYSGDPFVSISPDGSWFVVSFGYLITRYEASGVESWQFRAEGIPIRANDISPDGTQTLVVAGNYDDDVGKLFFLDSLRGTTVKDSHILSNATFAGAIADSGSVAVRAGEYKWSVTPELRFFDSALDLRFSRPTSGTNDPPWLGLSADGTRIVHAHATDVELISDDGKLLYQKRFPSAVQDVAISADGSHVAVAGFDGRLYLLSG